MKTTSKSATRKPSASPVRRPRKAPAAGSLTRKETTKLLLTAAEAFHYQQARGRVEPGSTFKDWRHQQVEDVCGKAGISKLARSDWRTVQAHFLILAGREDEAFQLSLKTGQKSYRPTGPNDTWESSEAIVHKMREALSAHATAPVTHPKGHLSPGWLLAAARQRTGKPSLTMDTLAERLDPKTLTCLLSHLRNHISLREGRADSDRRAPRSYPAQPDPGDFTPDPF